MKTSDERTTADRSPAPALDGGRAVLPADLAETSPLAVHAFVPEISKAFFTALHVRGGGHR
ncbi:hypothetical protein [Amycolatopsis alkalitolerans]|uniref:Uncharacterized protein n=1 Tax=Amycolatopsis alkalitolerans TaxID=2547244 RepID=A0A5C4M5E5_9PSEU|nr:hypothetical protein [Amycolatopsis alkalitolerans]TNC28464.1 hypothetical protein FG385_04065 [Amycolatopsis alkalitolerans]